MFLLTSKDQVKLENFPYTSFKTGIKFRPLNLQKYDQKVKKNWT